MQLDRQDIVLLSILQKDSSQSVGELADTVGMSKSACWRRLQKLEKEGVIRQRVALLDANALNLSLTVYISVRTNQHNDEWAATFQRATELIPGVLEVYRMSGDLDYLIKAVVADMPDYDRLYKQLIKADIYDVSSSFVMETLRHTTCLPL
ncbi:Lrp/AsnC family transcriptional regulator [Gammaproteobacteria bacterium]|jgi:Lrp/AsnC family transcriptional regulator|uniref:Transcriptional regulator n=5 Tax=OM182 clade TaxID=745002 RepID=A0A0R2SID0_9GAMM|nr:MAG: transcriptional regulator [OM182 bacterium BACL3 MAG-120507-bin80]KRO78941.1 MAG: transcriptional regulator [OM182 bacterium BACL3 MAG-120619-bin3]KRO85260.1 MAG: transcriptional regulator [OM182 bacterium BACL3 MAG-120920-bin41]KRP27875.1 MAG: transcriptional regulator [OM182 bacterium BACL3 MAG-120924-bin41]KRP38743.1 MAG: transcriptional regulator [OM182 bacterium BACL3 MAG-120531-bin86]MBT3521390.1 Lrp/AsnC family transcriptional regulator [Gammaproteobacteria bacterium]MDA9300743|tara:strand:+ start:100 stop:552 length:453 start_codon:yes stop_codon:yes gene_type:complete